MTIFQTITVTDGINKLEDEMRWAGEVPVEKWHGIPTEGKPDLVSLELPYMGFHSLNTINIAGNWDPVEYLRQQIQPNLPWADDHFAERVGGEPLNPGEQYKNWPWYQVGSKWDKGFRASGKFTHTYMERMWPQSPTPFWWCDLKSVVDLLYREPYTRQAWLPIWWPQDTGVTHGGRVPCTLGYHFMYRQERLNIAYVIRSCDVVRYLRDDIYMAARLLLWVLDQLKELSPKEETQGEHYWPAVTPGSFMFYCFSLHKFRGDQYVTR
jgi:hypothetical protein